METRVANGIRPESGSAGRSAAAGAERGRTRRPAERLLLGCALALVAWFYFWTVRPEGTVPFALKEDAGYYNLLIRGFLKGQLALDVEADPFLATLENPWLPEQRQGHGLPDASYHRGKYYLYFGVTPALLLYLPFHLITGWYLTDAAACLIFSLAGFFAAVRLVFAVRERHYPRSSTCLATACVLALGLGNMVPVLLRRTAVWEVPITCAFACFMIGAWALFSALHRVRRRWLWLAGASAAVGLAVGARPTYLVACLMFLPPLALWMREAGGARTCWGDRGWIQTLLAAVLPAALIGAGLGIYNFNRFGSFTEFGQSFQISTGDLRHTDLFGWRTLLYNLRLYLFSPAGLSPYFPFVTVISPPSAPAAQLGIENAYGVLPNIPFVAMVCGLAGLLRRRGEPAAMRLAAFAAGAALAAVGIMGTVAAFGGATSRYMVDFVPGLIVLACIGWMEISHRSSGWPVPIRRAASRVAGSMALFAVVFNVLVSMQHNDLLRVSHPGIYERVAYRANRVSHVIDRWIGAKYGPVELQVIFPQGGDSHNEPLVVTGRAFLSDYVFVNYAGDGMVRFCLEHTSRGTIVGDPVKIEPGRTRLVRVDMGSLYPPAPHPYFDGMTTWQARLRQRRLRVTLDGIEVLRGSTEFYDAVSRQPSIGTAGARPGFGQPFSGKILSWWRIPQAAPAARAVEFGPVRLEVTFPAFTGRRSEPLLCTGQTGRGDLIYATYESERQISFGHDHWGFGGITTAPVEIDPLAVHLLEIDFAALYPDGPSSDWPGPVNRDRLIIRLDGRTICDEPARHHSSRPDKVAVGANPIGASTATPQFSGSINWVERLEKPLARP